MSGLRSLSEESPSLSRHVFSAAEYNSNIRNRAKKYVEKYFLDDFIQIFADLKNSSEKGMSPTKNYNLEIPDELESTFAIEMITTFVKSLGYTVTCQDFSKGMSDGFKTKRPRDLTLGISL